MNYLCLLLLFSVIMPMPIWGYDDTFTVHPNDVPNFCKTSLITKTSAGAGSWDTAGTWTPNGEPGANDVVLIDHAVTLGSTGNTAMNVCVGTTGSFTFSRAANSALSVATLQIHSGGTLDVGTEGSPIPSGFTVEIIIRDKQFETSSSDDAGVYDPLQFRGGILCIDSTCSMQGATKTTYVRTDIEPQATDTHLSFLTAVSGWAVGDTIGIPDTRQQRDVDRYVEAYTVNNESRTISAIDGDNLGVTVSALTYDHDGARDADGTPSVVNSIPFMPHVGNFTRNVKIRSENASGNRGHVMMMHRSTVSIQYTEFKDMGRTTVDALASSTFSGSTLVTFGTNQVGRYPLHAHHLWGPINIPNTGYQFKFIGNAFTGSQKWPISIHKSHYGLIQKNVIYGGTNLIGSGIVMETGVEFENEIDDNFVMDARGNINPRTSQPGSGPNQEAINGEFPGTGGECYWAAGFYNRYTNNVAAACRNPVQNVANGPGWKFITLADAAQTVVEAPDFRGADMNNVAETHSVTMQYQKILEFDGNEAYGLMSNGMTIWYLGGEGAFSAIYAPQEETDIANFRVWHVHEAGFYLYPVNNLKVSNMHFRNNPIAGNVATPAIASGDYSTTRITVSGGTFHAGSIWQNNTHMYGQHTFENTTAVVTHDCFQFQTPSTPGQGGGHYDDPNATIEVDINNAVCTAWPAQSPDMIEMLHITTVPNTYLTVPYEVNVTDWQGNAADDFRIYWEVQLTQNYYGGLIPGDCDEGVFADMVGIICMAPATGPSVPSFLMRGGSLSQLWVDDWQGVRALLEEGM